MPDPNAHDQPAEGGREDVERTLEKQSEAAKKPPAGEQKSTPKDSGKDQK